jgi:hypothetical protein
MPEGGNGEIPGKTAEKAGGRRVDLLQGVKKLQIYKARSGSEHHALARAGSSCVNKTPGLEFSMDETTSKFVQP